ncbi:G-protein coupled receptor Mth2-like [Ceratina calcarata]|uniref:G-protein coupled receptor Mth2-like n=1 Tax=Ceratina calcarata TaxID=156304 RepID=A0AAJ7WG44_9HYME|nr:G-protein coupled receptor Mth2-like [Ceratina calcarata]XP_026675191.1 G-protein coupled receptor Mth2-like [Ceratina calcarata]
MGLRKVLMLSPILFCHLAICIDNIGDAPIVHPISLENATAIPDLPVVGKCCAVGEVLKKNINGSSFCTAMDSSVTEHFSPFFHEFNVSGYIAKGEMQNNFAAITGNPCKYRRYMLNSSETKEDINYLLMNGSVYRPYGPKGARMLQPGIDYCKEITVEFGLQTLVCYPEERIIITADSRITIYACSLLISVPFLILTIVAYSITPKLRNVYGKTLCCYCGCLTVGCTILAIAHLGNRHLSDQACITLAYVTQLSFVACFFWLNAMCIEKWSSVSSYVKRETYQRMNEETLFCWYSVWSWSPSVILILISIIKDLGPTIAATYLMSSHGKGSCSFKTDKAAMPYFYVPSGLLLLGNAIIFVLILIKLKKYQMKLDIRRLRRNEESDRVDRRHLRCMTKDTYVCMIVSLLVTLNWLMELIAWYMNGSSRIDWSPFKLVNALQGIWIFGLFVLRRPPRDFVWQRIQEIRGVYVEPEPELGSMEMFLVTEPNGDTTFNQTIIR